MHNRREFLTNVVRGSSLFALGSTVPGFLANTALAAESGKDTVLVVIELTGGNDGLNTVIPYADDLYHKARPTLRYTKEQVVRVDDHIGLNPSMGSFQPLLQQGHLAVVQGVGYPNPDRSHFESMDVWQSADPKRRVGTGWIGRSLPDLQGKKGGVPVMQVGNKSLPLALQGGAGGVVSINNSQPYRLLLDDPDPNKRFARKKLLEDLAEASDGADSNPLLPFVRRRQVQTYTTLERLNEVLQAVGGNGNNNNQNGVDFSGRGLQQKLQLVARLIQREFGTRIFYVSLDGFDTHSNQKDSQANLLGELANSIGNFFNDLRNSGHDKRVLAMTFSEFGRRVQENGSKGTDHGAASCMFVAGPAVKGGPVGKHPSLSQLDSGDLMFQIDFRRVYATLLDRWLGCDSKTVLGERFEPVELLRVKV